MKFFRKIDVFIFIFFVLLIFLLFFKTKENINYYKHINELNYNVTYEEAFPDSSFRNAVLYCIEKNICNNIEEELKTLDIIEIKKTELISEYSTDQYNYKYNITRKANERITKEDLDKIQKLVITRSNDIKNLQGIEYLTNLKLFYISSIKANNLNFNANKNLEYLQFYQKTDNINESCNITFSSLPKLKVLMYKIEKTRSNSLDIKNIDFSNNPNLEYLKTRGCNYNNVNLTTNSKLKVLDLNDNKITSLNLFNNNIIEELMINSIKTNNYNEELNKVPKLKKLDIRISEEYNLDLSNLPLLEDLKMNNSEGLRSINLSRNPNLKKIYIHSARFMTSIDFNKNLNLEDVEIRYSYPLNSINLPNTQTLKRLVLVSNQLNNIDVSKNKNLEDLYIMESLLNDLDISNNLKLKTLIIKKSNLSNIDIRKNIELKTLVLSESKFTNIDFSNNNLITSIDFSNNKLTKVDFRHLKDLYSFDVRDNLISEILIDENNTKLTGGYYANNKILNLKRNISGVVYLPYPQNIEIDVVKDQDFNIPIIYGHQDGSYYYGELKENNEVFKKVSEQTYRFPKLGKYVIDFKIYNKNKNGEVYSENPDGGTVTVTVKEAEILNFNPVFNTDIKYIDTNIDQIYTNNIVNLPHTASYKFLTETNTVMTKEEVKNIISTKGLKNFKIEIKFRDQSKKVVTMPVEIYEKKEKEIDLYSFIPTNEEYISYNNNKIFIKKNDLPENHCSSETYECYRYKRSEKTYNITEVTGNLNDILTDKYNTNIKFLNPSWTGNEERKVVDILEIDSEGQIKIVQTITILRDTDSDSIPDSIDEDDDNDQVSDTDEERDQTDPKDNTSYKVTKICYKINA